MKRINKTIAEKFVKDLKEGILQKLLTEIKRDDTLDLEFRDTYMDIYYRGGCISRLDYMSSKCYKDTFNSNYNKAKYEENNILELEGNITTNEDCAKLIKKLQDRKRVMNYWFTDNPQREREYKQAYVRENNDNVESNFYAIDLEYALETGGLIDSVAVQRKDGKTFSELKLVFLEMKYGNKAILSKNGKARYL